MDGVLVRNHALRSVIPFIKLLSIALAPSISISGRLSHVQALSIDMTSVKLEYLGVPSMINDRRLLKMFKS